MVERRYAYTHTHTYTHTHRGMLHTRPGFCESKNIFLILNTYYKSIIREAWTSRGRGSG